MDLTEFTLRILLLFVPGLIAFVLVDRLTVHKEAKFFHIIIYSFLLGVISYCVYYVGQIITFRFTEIATNITFFDALLDSEKLIDITEIFYVSGVAVIIGLYFSIAINHKWLHRLAQTTRISKKFGDIDVWSYVFNLDVDPWVIVRDLDNDFMYEGWVTAFSDVTDFRDEIFLQEVKVYKNSTGQELYEIPGMYISRKRENLLIEFPKLNESVSNPKNSSQGES